MVVTNTPCVNADIEKEFERIKICIQSSHHIQMKIIHDIKDKSTGDQVLIVCEEGMNPGDLYVYLSDWEHGWVIPVRMNLIRNIEPSEVSKYQVHKVLIILK